MADVIDKRNFFLSLSVLDGQRIAHGAGFSIPSEDVQQSELLDVVKKWLILSGSGITAIIDECIDWTFEVVEMEATLSAEERDKTREVITAYSVALLSRLLDSQMIHLDQSTLELPNVDASAFLKTLFRAIIEDEDEF